MSNPSNLIQQQRTKLLAIIKPILSGHKEVVTKEEKAVFTEFTQSSNTEIIRKCHENIIKDYISQHDDDFFRKLRLIIRRVVHRRDIIAPLFACGKKYKRKRCMKVWIRVLKESHMKFIEDEMKKEEKSVQRSTIIIIDLINNIWNHVRESAEQKFEISAEINQMKIEESQDSNVNHETIMMVEGSTKCLKFIIESNSDCDHFVKALFTSFCHVGVKNLINMDSPDMTIKALESIDKGKFIDEIYKYIGACVFLSSFKLILPKKIDLTKMRKLYMLIDLLSTLSYESSSAKGVVYFVGDINESRNSVQLTIDTKLSDRKGARKLFETSNGKFGLLVNYAGGIIGLGEVEQTACAWVKIVKHTWTFGFKSYKPIMKVDRSFVYPYNSKEDKDLNNSLTKMFPEHYEMMNKDLLSNIIDKAKSQGHGTMVVICSDAQEEARRLLKHSMPVTEFQFERDDIRVDALTRVDGALLIDLQGKCYAFGVILDGVENKNRGGRGNSNRGARYNSAFKYVDTRYEKDQKLKTIVVVISEDGYVDIVPCKDQMKSTSSINVGSYGILSNKKVDLTTSVNTGCLAKVANVADHSMNISKDHSKITRYISYTERSEIIKALNLYWNNVLDSAKNKLKIRDGTIYDDYCQIEYISTYNNAPILSDEIMRVNCSNNEFFKCSTKTLTQMNFANEFPQEKFFIRALFASFCHTSTNGMGVKNVFNSENPQKEFKEMMEENDPPFINEIYKHVGACALLLSFKEILPKNVSLTKMRELFMLFDLLSTQPYESSSANGIIYLANNFNNKNIIMSYVEIESKIKCSDRKGARKLFETSSGKFGLLVNDVGDIIGLGEMEQKECGWVKIGKHSWTFGNKSPEPMMNVDRGFVYSCNDKEKNLQESLIYTFRDIKMNKDLLIDIIDKAKSQGHGTMVVICSDAQEEAGRLLKHSMPVTEFQFERDDIRVDALTRVDGALLIDLQGKCYAFGVILDGVENKNRVGRGKSNRGARYNSAFKYVDTRYEKDQKLKTIVVVISEDGYVDVVNPIIVR